MLSILSHLRYSWLLYELNSSDETRLIQKNLDMRTMVLEGSLATYRRGGLGFERLVQEYLSTHVAILQCEEEISQLKTAKNASGL